MLNVGLTGNVAAGKSTVLQWFAAWGATVIDADELARDAQRPGSPVLAAIVRRFGDSVLRPDGSLDRARLRGLVMGDDAALAALNAIVHPAVQRTRNERAEAARLRGDCILLNDIPLLFEVLDPGVFDLIVLVDAPVELRKARLMQMRGLDAAEADRLIASQMPSEEKRRQSDVVLENDGSLDELRSAAWRAWCAIRTRAARHEIGTAGGLLAVCAYPGDESALMGGTLARYVDATTQVGVLVAGTVTDPLRRACSALGITGLRGIEDETHAVAAITAAAERAGHLVVISSGSDVGDLLRQRVQSWVVRAGTARRMAAFAVALEALARPHDTAPEEIAARIDVRPWRDRKQAALDAYGNAPILGRESSAWAGEERESFRAKGRVSRPVSDLFLPFPELVDSPPERR